MFSIEGDLELLFAVWWIVPILDDRYEQVIVSLVVNALHGLAYPLHP
jgi:hypothetical protein